MLCRDVIYPGQPSHSFWIHLIYYIGLCSGKWVISIQNKLIYQEKTYVRSSYYWADYAVTHFYFSSPGLESILKVGRTRLTVWPFSPTWIRWCQTSRSSKRQDKQRTTPAELFSLDKWTMQWKISFPFIFFAWTSILCYQCYDKITFENHNKCCFCTHSPHTKMFGFILTGELLIWRPWTLGCYRKSFVMSKGSTLSWSKTTTASIFSDIQPWKWGGKKSGESKANQSHPHTSDQ